MREMQTTPLNHATRPSRSGCNRYPSWAGSLRSLSARMRALVFLFSILVLAGLVSAQVLVSNNVTRAEAIKVASHLRVGVSEEDAGKFVANHGLTNAVGLGALTGWSLFYSLTAGSSLVLEYRPRAMTTNHWW